MKKKENRTTVSYYDAAALSYNKLYDLEALARMRIYPANYFRLQILLNSFLREEIRRVIEVGLGEGTPAFTLTRAGIEVMGFDVSESMVAEARKRLRDGDIPEERVFRADICDPITYAHALKNGPFDGLVAMGVMQHIEKDEFALNNMRNLVRKDGRVFIMFRNKLFSLFTFNRYTYEFIMNDLLGGVSEDVRERVSNHLQSTLRMDLPPQNKSVITTDTAVEKPIFSKFHNPFEVTAMFRRLGFRDITLHWYHYHPAMPLLEEGMPDGFQREAIRLEHETSGWRGMFLCSAFVVEAVRER